MAKAEKARDNTDGTAVILYLTEEEARTLAAMTGRVGGSPTYSPRGYVERISHALAKLGMFYDSRKSYSSAITQSMQMERFDDSSLYPENNTARP